MNKILIFILCVVSWSSSISQVGIGTDNPSEKAILEIAGKKNGDYKGFMPPRVPDHVAKENIAPTAGDQGLVVYVESTGTLELWNGNSWQRTHTNSQSGYAKDLFISEYVESSSGNNKAVEIANFTGRSINLGDYEILVNSNGGVPGSPTASAGTGGISVSATSLGSATLAHGQVVVVRTDNASGISTGIPGPRTFFDGNDALVLRKKGLGQPWIDVMGMPGVDWEYGKAVTLRRKPGYGPSRIYVPGQFEVFPSGTYNGLGSHTY